ncbi:MAG: hypothetical protein NC453_18865 [Muribaculum sp.]|nr:hypothetical protein [Muribaculum sp.]
MKSIPDTLKNLLHDFMRLFSSDEYKGKDYKSKLLQTAQDDEERQDLQELFQSTADFYAEKKAISDSNTSPSDYLLNLYISSWKEWHPDATYDEIKAAKKEYEIIVSEGIIQELENLKDDSTAVEDIFDRLDRDAESDDLDSAQYEYKN